jgi:hypothetical protein
MPRSARYGWVYPRINFYFPLPLAATAETKFAEALGFAYEVISGKFFTQVAGTGGGATRTVQVKKGSDIIGSVAITLAGTSDIGEETALSFSSMTSDTSRFSDADVLTIDFPASGTAFTAGAGILSLLIRTKPQL